MITVMILVSGCTALPEADVGIVMADDRELRVVALSEADVLEDVVGATRIVGMTMLSQGDSDANMVVSPSSVVVALSMLSEGAHGDTLAELESVIGATGESRRDVLAALRSALREFEGDPSVVQDRNLPEKPLLHLAAQVVVDDELIVEDAYLEALADVYAAGVQFADLGSGDAKKVLDAWVRYHSGGLIQESAINPDDMLRLVIQDAVVLAARWQSPFSAEATRDRAFFLSDGAEINVPTMMQDGYFTYVEIEGWQALRLFYVGQSLHADFILPPKGIDPATARADLLAELSAALDEAVAGDIEVYMPALDVQNEEPADLVQALRALGLERVFDEYLAELSGIGIDVNGDNLFLNQAVQQAVLQVDEEGTRAAAVTELGLAGSMLPEMPQEIRFDRPYLIQIAHTESSWPLFLAAIRDPR